MGYNSHNPAKQSTPANVPWYKDVYKAFPKANQLRLPGDKTRRERDRPRPPSPARPEQEAQVEKVPTSYVAVVMDPQSINHLIHQLFLTARFLLIRSRSHIVQAARAAARCLEM